MGVTKAVKFWICLEIKVIKFHDGLEVGCDQSEGRSVNLWPEKLAQSKA